MLNKEQKQILENVYSNCPEDVENPSCALIIALETIDTNGNTNIAEAIHNWYFVKNELPKYR